ncbi:MAG: methylmalonyl Co-A mutase-associated GTPase MeaB [Acidiferrobacteraceae bacterium]|jgi:LAO/AO transport system kinase|nr:methylmalonyl Co-A mutase-associated GTPase MeaB [Acidiferrobacteraceae bacterium]MDP6434266.1 methylmalonyl Co-A mutase-associated GTPase MeaB [Arenicellales bacterium]MDP6671805.1 methylmalonyl Co-A mutase-associated GTPase MeaB [Arenicellales bacterium]MDP6723940.1 methylmalonyl Co-A mutase-associated GTPase MeaB [Arenicellales bacterium]|tara:strand:+ start:355 stop:1350 length:996 start_codon:yes stop_codon:yes gene_type:complete
MVDDRVERLAKDLMSGDRRALARAITLIESSRQSDRTGAAALLEQVIPSSGEAVRIGISGAPGAGKSTFIEALGNHLIDLGHRPAVLTVDPSSVINGGSILGDKTRMETLAKRDQAFIRPSPSGRTLGGVTRRTRESMLLCEAAGHDVVIVETVGVGQSEIAVAEMTDMFILLLHPASGDELQGIKRGIMEIADMVLVNKADGELKMAASRSALEFSRALSLMHSRDDDWVVPVVTCSALTKEGVDEAWKAAERYLQLQASSGARDSRREKQASSWLWGELTESLLDRLRDDPEVEQELRRLEENVAQHNLPARVAAGELLEKVMGRAKEE